MSILQDIRFGLRMLAKNPGFTIVAVLALALGIGVNSMMFTIYNAALVKSLPFESPDFVTDIHNRNLAAGTNRLGVSYRDFLEYRQSSRSFASLAAFAETEFTISDERSVPDQVEGVRMTPNTFSLIGQRPMLGRDLRPEDERPEADSVALMSFSLWQTRYGGDPSIMGKSVKLSGQYHTIVGIMPRGMEFPERDQIWIPIRTDLPEPQRIAFSFRIVGRLYDSVTPKQAQTELTEIGNRISANHPETNKGIEPVVQRYIDSEVSPGEKMLLQILLGAVFFVLLIACANVANLLLSRAVHRSRETSIRVALGAGRWRVVRQLLIESLLLSLTGGVFGLGVAIIGVRMFAKAIEPVRLPFWVDFSMDRVAFGYLFAICVFTGIVFGLAPALQLSKTDINQGLRETGRGTSGGLRSRRLTGALVIAEISLALVLMVGASLMVRSLFNLESLDVGVRADNVVTMALDLPSAKYSQPADRIALTDRVLERLRGMPGLESFAIASHVPVRGAARRPLELEGRDLNDRNGKPRMIATLFVGPDYFRALGVTLRGGREFSELDGRAGAEAAIVSERFAAQYWPHQNPLGQRLRLGTDAWATVVGVSPPIIQTNLTDIEAVAYLPYRQVPAPHYNIIVRSRTSRVALVQVLREEIHKLDDDLPVSNIQSLDEIVNSISVRHRILGVMFSAFALIGLILAAVGIYAVTAYAAGQRTQEIGVRIALGAGNRNVLWLVLRSGLGQLAVALPIGISAAVAVTGVLTFVLFQVAPLDPMTFVSIPILLSLIVFAACLIPAWRAARLNPVEALRTE